MSVVFILAPHESQESTVFESAEGETLDIEHRIRPLIGNIFVYLHTRYRWLK